MRKILMAVAVLSAAVIAACSSGGGKGRGLTLSSGTYVASNASDSPNTCFGLTPAQINGHNTFTLAAGTSLVITAINGVPYSGIALVQSGATLSTSPLGVTLDYSSNTFTGLFNTYDCQASWSRMFQGTVTAPDVWTLNDTFTTTWISGTQCFAAETSELNAVYGAAVLGTANCLENVIETLNLQ